MDSEESIHITSYSTPHEFLQATTLFLVQREWQNNIPLGILGSYLTSTPPQDFASTSQDAGEFTLLATSNESEEIILVAFETPSFHYLCLASSISPTAFSATIQAHLRALAHYLLHTPDKESPKALNGDKRLAFPLAEILSQSLHLKPVIQRTDTMASIRAATLSTKAHHPPALPLSHEIRRITYPRDLASKELILEMYAGMFFETRQMIIPQEVVEAAVDAAIGTGDAWAYFIDKNTPAATAFLGRRTEHGMAVRNVFTRQEYRKRGFAERLVGEVCRVLLLGSEVENAEKLDYLQIFFSEGSIAERIYRRLGFGGEGAVGCGSVVLQEVDEDEEGRA